jgi:hypothetical protein
MSLKTFHIVFITMSFLLAVAFGAWCLRVADAEGEGPWRIAAMASFAAAAALVVYGVWFLRKLRRLEEDAARKKTSPIGGGPPGDRGGTRAARHVGL